MSWTKKVTTTEEYDATGKLIKRTTVTEENGTSYDWYTRPYQPYVPSYPVYTPQPWQIEWGTSWTSDHTTYTKNIGDDDDEPDAGVGAKV